MKRRRILVGACVGFAVGWVGGIALIFNRAPSAMEWLGLGAGIGAIFVGYGIMTWLKG